MNSFTLVVISRLRRFWNKPSSDRPWPSFSVRAAYVMVHCIYILRWTIFAWFHHQWTVWKKSQWWILSDIKKFYYAFLSGRRCWQEILETIITSQFEFDKRFDLKHRYYFRVRTWIVWHCASRKNTVSVGRFASSTDSEMIEIENKRTCLIMRITFNGERP